MPAFRGKDPWTAVEPVQVIVEGPDDQMALDVLAAQLRARGQDVVPFDVQCAESQGKIARKLAEFVRTEAFVARVHSLAIVVDADDAPEAAFAAMQEALRGVGLSAPETTGTWHASSLHGLARRVRIDLVPAGDRGALETLVLQAVDPEHIACVESYLACIQGFGQPAAKHRSKAFVQILAAAKLNDGYMNLGVAIRERVLSIDHAAFDDLRKLLIELAGDTVNVI